MNTIKNIKQDDFSKAVVVQLILKTKHTNVALFKDTHGHINVTTPLVKHYNDLLGRQSSERGKDEVSYFYVGDVFCIHLGSKYANFQEKIFA